MDRVGVYELFGSERRRFVPVDRFDAKDIDESDDPDTDIDEHIDCGKDFVIEGGRFENTDPGPEENDFDVEKDE